VQLLADTSEVEVEVDAGAVELRSFEGGGIGGSSSVEEDDMDRIGLFD